MYGSGPHTGNRKPRMGPGHQGKAGRSGAQPGCQESVAGCSARDHAHDPTKDDQHVPIHRRSALHRLHVWEEHFFHTTEEGSILPASTPVGEIDLANSWNYGTSDIPFKTGPSGEPIKNGLLGRFPNFGKDNSDVEYCRPPPSPPPGPAGFNIVGDLFSAFLRLRWTIKSNKKY